MKIGQGNTIKSSNAFALALLLLSLSSCASLPEDAIVGRWNAIDGTDRIVLSKNGAITAIDRDKSELVIGSYKFVAQDKVRFDSNGKDPDFKSLVATVALSGNEMTITSPDGKSSKYRRAE